MDVPRRIFLFEGSPSQPRETSEDLRDPSSIPQVPAWYPLSTPMTRNDHVGTH